MRVMFFGSGDFGEPALRWLANSKHEVVAVVTRPDRPAGRGKQLQPTPIALRAATETLRIIKCDDVNRPAAIDDFKKFGADLAVVIDFGQKLKEPLRSVFPGACINLHGSLLPKYRGAAPIARAMLAGEAKTGVTAFRLVDRMDAGPMLVKRETMIGRYETADELHGRLAGIACDALDAALKLYESDPLTPGEPQNESEATCAPKLSRADGRLDFNESAEAIGRRCRAMWPWPGARCRFVGAGKSVDVTICSATANPAPAADPPGTITAVLTVATGGGTLEIHSLQPAGKRAMGWQDFVNGRHVQPGDRFESIEP
ncbi:MAG TPA: methionyl-tRNA formyltransferase [Phycisphaerae bacterium]|nr:methionyl-tRNA formyltransferase [Phycisphaerae bacterium]